MSTFRYYADIDFDALAHNVSEIRRRIGERTKLCSVIKANAYGHGAVEFAQFLENGYTDWFAVSSVDEGLELRNAGIKKPVLVLGTTFECQYKEAIKNDITLTVYTYDSAKRLSEAAVLCNKTANVHIKLDTGMGRIGFSVCEASADAIAAIAGLENIDVEGLFTHFACADMEDRETTNRQIKKYKKMVDMLLDRGIDIPLKHCANSAGIMEYSEVHMDMVRAGIILYGLYPSDEISHETIDLKPVMSLKSHIAYIKTIPAGTAVSYGGTYVTDKETVLATIPVGYADGYFRSLSNKGSVLIHGQYAPICGRVCMDQFMVDITDIPEVHEGDSVVIMGRDGDQMLSAEEISSLAGSFNYELVCEVSRRVPRVYYEHGRRIKEVHYLSGVR